MPIRMTVRIENKELDGYRLLVGNANRMIAEVVGATVKKHQPRYLEPVRTADPGPSQHSGRWSTIPADNARARRGYWARVRSGQINADPVTGAYIRSGDIARQWQMNAKRNRVALFNDSPAIKYVSTLGAILARGGQPNPGHILTGWPQKNTALAIVAVNTMVNDVQSGIAATTKASIKAGSLKVVIHG